MTDRELLEAAAKAAGVVLLQVPNAAQTDADWWAYAAGRKPDTAKPWNPLNDDGDALRLAVKMRIDLHTSPINGDAVIVTAKHRMRSDLLRQPNPTTAAENCAPDPYAATRRAIVRAAASMAQTERTA
jgi:hypothetical protein